MRMEPGLIELKRKGEHKQLQKQHITKDDNNNHDDDDDDDDADDDDVTTTTTTTNNNNNTNTTTNNETYNDIDIVINKHNTDTDTNTNTNTNTNANTNTNTDDILASFAGESHRNECKQQEYPKSRDCLGRHRKGTPGIGNAC